MVNVKYRLLSLVILSALLFAFVSSAIASPHALESGATGRSSSGRYEAAPVDEPVDKPAAAPAPLADPGRFFSLLKSQHAEVLEGYRALVPFINRFGNSTVPAGASRPLREGSYQTAIRTELWLLDGKIKRDIAELENGEKNERRMIEIMAEISRAKMMLKFAEKLHARRGEFGQDDDALVKKVVADFATEFTAAEKKKSVLFRADVLDKIAPPGNKDHREWAETQVRRIEAVFGPRAQNALPIPADATSRWTLPEMESYLIGLAIGVNQRDAGAYLEYQQNLANNDQAALRPVREAEGWDK